MKKLFFTAACMMLLQAAFCRQIAAPGINSGYYQSGNGSWLPGDTIVFTPGTSPRTYFTLDNVNGTAAAHITLMASGGQIEMMNGFALNNCNYIDIDGMHAGVDYGFFIHHISDYAGDPINLSGMTSHIKICGFKAMHTNDGVRVKNDLSCDSSSKWPYRFTGIEICHFWLEDFTNEGMYLGNTDPYDQTRTINCGGTTVHYRVSGLDSFSVHDGVIIGAHRQGINFSGADGDSHNWFYNLYIYNCGYPGVDNQGAGIFIGSASRNVHIYNCTIRKTYNIGVHSYCESLLDMHNNVIDSSGWVSLGATTYYIGGMNNVELNNFGNFTYKARFNIQNNTLGANTAGKNIALDNNANKYETTGNIICNSGTVNNPTAWPYSSICNVDTATKDSVVYVPCDSLVTYHLSRDTTLYDTVPVKDTVFTKTFGKLKRRVRWHHNIVTSITARDSTIYYDSVALCQLCATCVDTIKVPVQQPTTYGVFILNNDSIHNAQDKIVQTKKLGATAIRIGYDVGTSYTNQQYKDSGLYVTMTYNTTDATVNDPAPFPTNLTEIANTFDSLMSISAPDHVSFLNEPPLFWTGTCEQYIDALAAMVPVAHAHGIKISDGGQLAGVIWYMAKVYRDENKTDSLLLLGTLTGKDTANLLYSAYAVQQQTWYEYFISHIAATGVDAVNVHWYERPFVADSAMITTSKLLPLVVNFFKSRTGLPVITDETGTRNYNTALLNDMLSEWKALGPELVIYFDGNGTYARASAALEGVFKMFIKNNP